MFVLQRQSSVYDVIVVGGGPAGMSAALMLGRCRRRVLLCDGGSPRNRRSRALHGYLTRDGIAPTDFTAIGRQELSTYGIEVRGVGVTAAERTPGGFLLRLDGGATEASRFLLLATGVIDELPGIPGFDDCYGRSVFHCPYCDGWEWRGQRLAVFGAGAGGVGLALGLLTWTDDVLLCTNGRRLDRASAARLGRHRVALRTDAIASLEHDDGLLQTVRFESGEPVARDALFFTTGQHPQSPLAITLGCTLTRRGTVDTGSLCATNVPGLFVAGDASRDAQFVVVAAAEGVKAAVAINKALQKEAL